MASEQTTYQYGYDVSLSFGTNDDNLTIWDSTQHAELKGKFVSVVIQLTCECQNTSPRNGTYDIVLESTSGFFNSEEIEIGTKTVGAASKPVDKFSKILSSRMFANNGDCDIKIYFKRVFASISNKLSGTITGSIKCTVTSEEDKESETTVGLDKNAITDWFKTLSVDGTKSGETVKKEYPVKYRFAEGSLGHTLWTNSEISDMTMDEVAVSIGGNLTNIGTTSKTVDIDFVASGGSGQNFATIIRSVMVGAGSTVEFNASTMYSKSQFPNDGVCSIKISATNTEDIRGLVLGQINVTCSTLSNAETENYTDDTDIQTILNNLFSDGYSVSDDTDSFMSAYSGSGYDDDSALLSSDQYKMMGMTDDMATHIQELEARITALENRMTELNIGGSDLDWYDGGYTGSDDTWGIGSWYEQTDDRISQTEERFEASSEMLNNPETYTVDVANKKITEIYTSINSNGRIFKSVTYSVMVSHLAPKQLWLGTVLNFYLQSEFTGEENIITKIGEVKFSDVTKTVTENFEKTIIGSSLCNNGICTVKLVCEYISPYNTTQETQELFDDLIASLNGKITANLTYQMQEDTTADKIKETDNTNVTIDIANFTGEQNIFSYSAQSNNTNLQTVDFSLTLSYTYDTEQSQLCVGQKIRVYFRTVATHGGFADEITEFPIGEYEITADSPTKQYVVKDKYTIKSFANNGNCTAYIVFSTPNITAEKLADFKQYFSGNVKGTVNYKAVNP